MHPTIHFPPLAAFVLLLAAPFAGADSMLPLPDPVAPAVVGRPLDRIRPARPAHPKPVAAKPVRREQVATAHQAMRTVPPTPVLVAPAPVQQAIPAQQVPNQVPVRRIERTGPGGYFSSKDHALVSRYYATHPASAQVAKWKPGEPIPPKSALTGVPDDLRAALSTLPPGHQYVEVDGDVVLVAVQSRVVVDGISRAMR